MSQPDLSHSEPSGTLDAAQAAQLCKCSVRLLSRLAKTGVIPATKVGRSWVFSARLLQEWIDDRALANVSARAHIRASGGVTVTQALIANGGSRGSDQPKTSS